MIHGAVGAQRRNCQPVRVFEESLSKMATFRLTLKRWGDLLRKGVFGGPGCGEVLHDPALTDPAGFAGLHFFLSASSVPTVFCLRGPCCVVCPTVCVHCRWSCTHRTGRGFPQFTASARVLRVAVVGPKAAAESERRQPRDPASDCGIYRACVGLPGRALDRR